MSYKPNKTRTAEDISVRVKPVAKGYIQITVIENATGEIFQKNWKYKIEFDRHVISSEMSAELYDGMVKFYNDVTDELVARKLVSRAKLTALANEIRNKQAASDSEPSEQDQSTEVTEPSADGEEDDDDA